MNVHKLAVLSCFLTAVSQLAKFGQDDGLAATSMCPKREEFQWRPSPILCKRFDLIDPYMGKVPTMLYISRLLCVNLPNHTSKFLSNSTLLLSPGEVAAVDVIDFFFL